MRDHALFVCFAPASAPRYAAAVVVEHGGGGAKVAGPIARDIMIECQQRDPARPLRTAGSGAAMQPRRAERPCRNTLPARAAA